MNIFDIGIILLFIMFFITGFKRGVIKEIVSLVGIIVVFVIAFLLKGIVGNLLCIIMPFFNFTGQLEGITTINIFLYQAIGFLLTFSILIGIYEIIVKISNALQKIVNLTIVLVLPSKILGGIVSLVKGYIVLFVVFIVLVVPLKESSIFSNSALVNQILYKTPILSDTTNSFITPLDEVYLLTKKVSSGDISTNDANLETLDIMLKYNIVNKGTIETLVKLHKLDNVNYISSVLDKY